MLMSGHFRGKRQIKLCEIRCSDGNVAQPGDVEKESKMLRFAVLQTWQNPAFSLRRAFCLR